MDKICGKRCHSIPLPPMSMLLAAKLFFLPKDFIKNNNIDVGRGKSVPKILHKVDMCACDGK